MIDIEENKRKLFELTKKVEDICNSINIDKLEEKAINLEKETLKEGFWSEMKTSNSILQELKLIKSRIKKIEEIKKIITNIEDIIELIELEQNENFEKEFIKEINNLQNCIDKFEVQMLLSDKFDKNNAIITLHPGAGGTESQDWAEMLYRMYSRWANKNNYKVKEIDYLEGDEAGLKSVTFLVEGDYAYGYMKSEQGVHRLVRISPFDAGGRRHTSFASVEVLPEITDDIELEINPSDLRIDTYRSSGAGGQHINKTDSAVRITHIPTGIVTTCQSERSQIMNRESAMKMLKSKLLDLKEKQNKEKIEDLKGDQKEIAWGSQIRSYVFCPYTLVKDHRTNYETGNIEAVMNGEIDKFMEMYLRQYIKNK